MLDRVCKPWLKVTRRLTQFVSAVIREVEIRLSLKLRAGGTRSMPLDELASPTTFWQTSNAKDHDPAPKRHCRASVTRVVVAHGQLRARQETARRSLTICLQGHLCAGVNRRQSRYRGTNACSFHRQLYDHNYFRLLSLTKRGQLLKTEFGPYSLVG